ncbi:MAG TPA: hypothetical protein VFT46_11875 [Holophagaceae bacterium]|nr:hypothetical protein [Holophagaceae bacterium]
MRAPMLLALSALLALPALAGVRTEQKSLPLKAGGTLSVSTANSPIHVEGWDRDEVAVTAQIEDSEDRPVRWEMRAEGAGVTVEALFPKAAWGIHLGHGPSCAFTVKVPRSVVGTFTTSNDIIAAGGFGGSLTFRTTNDDITLEHLDGAVAVSTTNGAITARHLKASLKGSTTNDTLRLEDVEGGIDLATTNSAVVASGLDGRDQGIALRTTNGDMTIDLGRATGVVHARTSRHEEVRIERKGVDLLESGGGQLKVRIPGSAQAIDLSTTNGSITLR